MPQCIKNDNVANYKGMIRNWITHYVSLVPRDSQDKTLYSIPCSKRYIVMAEIDRAPDIMVPTPAVGYVLRPSSPLDVREMTLWIKSLLHRIHKKVSYAGPEIPLTKMHIVLRSTTSMILSGISS